MRRWRLSCPLSVFDHAWLMDQLQNFASPRSKVTRMLRDGDIIRIRQGLYMLPHEDNQEPIPLYMIANLIYSPSYVSLETALQHYGLIPEHVVAITSMTSGKKRIFQTPIGRFTYAATDVKGLSVGLRWVDVSEREKYFIASPEKALVDRLRVVKTFSSKDELYAYIVEGLRIEPELLRDLDRGLVKELAEVHRKKTLKYLVELL